MSPLCGRTMIMITVSADYFSIYELARTRSKALIGKDAEAMREILTDDFTYTNASGKHLSREEYIATYVTAPSVRWLSQEISDVEVWPLGDYAVFACTVHDVAIFDSDELNAHFRSIYLYVKRPQGWRCLAGHTRTVDTHSRPN